MLLSRFSSCGGPWTLADCRLETVSGVHLSVCSTLSFSRSITFALYRGFLRACMHVILFSSEPGRAFSYKRALSS